jgi:hypothetical protein
LVIFFFVFLLSFLSWITHILIFLIYITRRIVNGW